MSQHGNQLLGGAKIKGADDASAPSGNPICGYKLGKDDETIYGFIFANGELGKGWVDSPSKLKKEKYHNQPHPIKMVEYEQDAV